MKMDERIETKKMKQDLQKVIESHGLHPKKESKAYRKWDGETPYSMHPIWCAMTILTETELDEEIRMEGYQALLYHDILEDTTVNLPDWISERVRELVAEMTFPGGSRQEMNEIWNKPRETRLCKLYDKVSNLMDGSWMDSTKRQEYENYTKRLCEDVERNYGELNITRIARGIVEGRK